MSRSIKVRPSNMRRNDILPDGRVVASVSGFNGGGYVVMFNGGAIHFDRDHNEPQPIRRPGWQSVKGSALEVGQRLRAGNAVYTITGFDAREGWVAVVLDGGYNFRLDMEQTYTIWK